MLQSGVVAIGDSFWNLHATDLVIGVGALFALPAYFLDRSRDRRERKEGQAKAQAERETAVTQQAKFHAENSEKLTALIRFRDGQEELNRQRDSQVSALQSMAHTTVESLAQISKAMDRRLELIEDELRETRRGGRQ